MAHYLPSLVVPPIVNRLRHETQNVILPGEEEDLRRYLEERRRAGMRLNLNQLGEAILGEAEAARRLEAYLALLARDDVEYISVKVSSVFSQIDLVAFRATVARVAERLRTLYRAGRAPPLPASRRARHAEVHQPRHGGVPRPRPHGDGLPRGAGRAGVPAAQRGHRAPGLPARLATACSGRSPRGRSRVARAAARPSSCASSRAPTWRWSASRPRCTAGPRRPYETQGGGGRQLQAHGRVRLPARARGGRPPRASPATTSSTSPTASCCARPAASRPWVEFEMLEGMANHQARAVQARAGRPPALRAGRARRGLPQRDRLSRPPAGREHRARELPAPRLRPRAGLAGVDHRARSLPGRVRPRRATSPTRRAAPRIGGRGGRAARPRRSRRRRFDNEPDTDWTLAANRAWIESVVARVARAAPDADPAPDRRRASHPGARGGRPRSLAPGRVAYRYALARPRRRRSRADAARAAQPAWAALRRRRARGPCSRRARTSSGGAAAT